MTPPPTFAIVYNRDENIEGGDVRDAIASQGNLEALVAVESALSTLGRVVTLDTADGDPERLARALKAAGPRAVFNLAEAVRGRPDLEPTIPAILELLAIPYTGSGPFTLALCLDKARTKALLAGHGVPTPEGRVVSDAARDTLDGLRYPTIVKPAALDASHGIEADCVVGDERAARRRAAATIASYGGSVLVEEFIDGRELNVTVADDPPVVLPIAEVDFRLLPGVPKVVGYEAKWIEGSEAFARTPIVCPASLDPQLEERVRSVVLRAFLAVRARDYARVDVRVDGDGRPFVLEVNPNPDISPDAGVARSARMAGWRYDDLVRRFVHLAILRSRPATAQPRRS